MDWALFMVLTGACGHHRRPDLLAVVPTDARRGPVQPTSSSSSGAVTCEEPRSPRHFQYHQMTASCSPGERHRSRHRADQFLEAFVHPNCSHAQHEAAPAAASNPAHHRRYAWPISSTANWQPSFGELIWYSGDGPWRAGPAHAAPRRISRSPARGGAGGARAARGRADVPGHRRGLQAVPSAARARPRTVVRLMAELINAAPPEGRDDGQLDHYAELP